jgi:hypothetical protein
MELLNDVGVYPIPQELSVSNIIKGWLFLSLFLCYCVVDLQVAFWIRATSFFIPNTTSMTVRQFMNDLFWQLLIYLINKRKVKIIISGVNLKDPLIHDALLKSVVISNHKSLFDYLLIFYLKTLVEKATGERITLSFFIWSSIWQAPGFKLFWKLLNNDENWEMNVVELEQQLIKLFKLKENNWIAHFPEVNICTEKNLTLQGQQLERNFIPKFKDVLYPRFNNFNNLIKAVGNNANSSTGEPLKNVLGLTILYYNPVKNAFTNPTLFEILTLKQPVFIIDVDFRMKLLNKLPLKNRKLEKWLENEWTEKDKILNAMQKQLKLNFD